LDNARKSFEGAAITGERRRANRYNFSETAEVVEMASGARLSTRAADLSQKGCYLDTLNPFATGSIVRLRILWDGAELKCAAVVRDSQPGMGMGIAFTDLDDAQKALIESWIEKLTVPPGANLSPSPRSENAKPAPTAAERDALAVRLIGLLHKKGLLSTSDVASLLSERLL
jgi:hypothetical protein